MRPFFKYGRDISIFESSWERSSSKREHERRGDKQYQKEGTNGRKPMEGIYLRVGGRGLAWIFTGREHGNRQMWVFLWVWWQEVEGNFHLMAWGFLCKQKKRSVAESASCQVLIESEQLSSTYGLIDQQTGMNGDQVVNQKQCLPECKYERKESLLPFCLQMGESTEKKLKWK